ncbi:hypothetical protein [Persicitalea sp.]|uniref:hypothetical protein n=1 Tax=Persicitalea sp. TaxID=3100273 RepID=UPI003593F317
MKSSSLYFLFTFVILPIAAKAQFQAGQSFVSGGLSLNLNDNKYKGPNTVNQSANYSHNIDISSGYFTRNNKAVGWTLSQSLSTNTNASLPNYPGFPSKLRYLGFGGSRFVEYYKPVFEKVSVYIQPSVGLKYGLDNEYNRVILDNGTNAFSLRRTNTFTLGMNLNAGVAWQVAPKWVLYGTFAYFNPISISAGWKNTENPPVNSPRSGPAKTEGSFLNYNLVPSLDSGYIGLGFRYFYTRNKSSI